MNHTKYYFLVLTVIFSFVLNQANAANSHVHGHAKATLVLDNDKLNFTMTVPAYDILGFEHAPNNKEEEAIVKTTINNLEEHKNWLKFNPNLCSLNKIKVTSPFSHHHDHKSEDNHTHNDFDITIEYLCKNSKEITSVNVIMHHLISKIKTIELQWLAHNKQSLIIINKDQQEVIFDD